MLVVGIVNRGVEAISPHGASAGRFDQTSVTVDTMDQRYNNEDG